MDQVLKTPVFNRWMKKIALKDKALVQAVHEMKQGLIDADLGQGLLKKRVPLPGRGKRGAARTLLASNKKGRWIFLFGFQKNDRENITVQEKEALQALSSDLLGFTEVEIRAAVVKQNLMEVYDETEK